MFLENCEAENVAQDSDYADGEHDGSLGGVSRQMHLKDEQLPDGMGFGAVGANGTGVKSFILPSTWENYIF